jgi:hypothetical protein
VSVLKDRQLIVSPGPTTGVVTVGTDSNYDCLVSFRGRAVSARSMGKNTLAAGDIVSVADIDGLMFAIKQSAGYPTRYKRPLTDWAARHPANLLLQLCLRNAKKEYTYRLGVVSSVAGDNSLIVECWDGLSRQCPVEYADELRSSSAFEAGEAVVLHQKAPNNWIVIGKLAALSALPSSIDFGEIAVGGGSDPVAVDVAQIGSTAAITVTAPSSFAVGETSGGAFSISVALPGAGGIFYAKATPLSVGEKTGNISIVSADAAAVVAVSAEGVQSIVFTTPVCAGFPEYGDVLPITTPSGAWIGPVAVTCSDDFQISLSAEGPWSTTLAGFSAGGSLYCRANPVDDGITSWTFRRVLVDFEDWTVADTETSQPITRAVTGSVAFGSEYSVPVSATAQALTVQLQQYGVTGGPPLTNNAGYWVIRGRQSFTPENTSELTSSSYVDPYGTRGKITCRGRANISLAIRTLSGTIVGNYSWALNGVDGPTIDRANYGATTIFNVWHDYIIA